MCDLPVGGSEDLESKLKDEVLLGEIRTKVGEAILGLKLSDGSSLVELLKKFNVQDDLMFTISIESPAYKASLNTPSKTENNLLSAQGEMSVFKQSMVLGYCLRDGVFVRW